MAGLNNSIFDLPNSLEQLRRPEDVIKISTRKIIPKSASKLAQFGGSDITFDFTLSGNQHWLASRSYVVIRDVLAVGAGGAGAQAPLDAADVYNAYSAPDNLFDGCQLTIGGFSLGSKTKSAPQISSCERRLSKSASWFDGFGASTMNTIASQVTRKAHNSRSAGGAGIMRNEWCYQPCLGAFKQGKALPPAR